MRASERREEALIGKGLAKGSKTVKALALDAERAIDMLFLRPGNLGRERNHDLVLAAAAAHIRHSFFAVMGMHHQGEPTFPRNAQLAESGAIVFPVRDAECSDKSFLPSPRFAEDARPRRRSPVAAETWYVRTNVTSLTALDLELLDAAGAGDANRVRAAIAAGADVNGHDPRPVLGAGNTPLHFASTTGNTETVIALLHAGADVNATCDCGWTPLMRACNGGDAGVAELLLDAGADPHIRNTEGYTAWGRTPGNAVDLIALLRARNATNTRAG